MGTHAGNKKLSETGKRLSHWMIDNEKNRGNLAVLLGCTPAFITKVFQGGSLPPIEWVSKLDGDAKHAVLDGLYAEHKARFDMKTKELQSLDDRLTD